MKEKNIDEEEENIINDLYIELKFLDLSINLQINNDYNSFISNICKIIKISEKDIDSVILNYLDDDEDSIIISNKGDYDIFYSQVQDNTVKKLEIKIKEDSKLNMDECFANFCNYIEINEENNNNKIIVIKEENDDNTNNKINNINIIEEEEQINKINNFNDDKIDIKLDEKEDDKNVNGEIKIIDDYFNYKKINKKNIKETFECECSSCNEYPIFNILYYCPYCDIYLCSRCKANTNNHEHVIFEVKSNEELADIIYSTFEIINKDKNQDKNEQKNKFSDYVPKFIKNMTDFKLSKFWKKEKKIKNNE